MPEKPSSQVRSEGGGEKSSNVGIPSGMQSKASANIEKIQKTTRSNVNSTLKKK